MMKLLNIADTDLKTAVEDVIRTGREVVFGREGTPLAKLVPIRPKRCHRLDLFAGQIVIADDFDQWPDDEARSFGIQDDGK